MRKRNCKKKMPAAYSGDGQPKPTTNSRPIMPFLKDLSIGTWGRFHESL